MFQHAFMSTDSEQQPSSDVPRNDEGIKQQRAEVDKKQRRPLNSYLKVELDDDTMDWLHDIAVKLQNDMRSMAKDGYTMDRPQGIIDVNRQNDKQNTSKDDEGTEREMPTAIKKHHFNFRPRSRTSLHMTLFFGGEVLCALPPSELIDWHANVKARLKQSNFALKLDPAMISDSKGIEVSSTDLEPQAPEESEQAEPTELQEESKQTKRKETLVQVELEQDQYWFRIKGLSLFPPRRNYLIVALLEASPSWHALHDDLRELAASGDLESLRSITKRGKGEWTPHITLGNLYGGKKADLGAVRKMLQDFPLNDPEIESYNPASEHLEVNVERVEATRISMGGPVPQQVELDWNFLWEST
jgi:2'-5' RNA ligase